MASDRPADEQADDGLPGRHGGSPPAAADLGIDAAGAADEELAFVLGVEIDQRFARKETLLKRFGSVHARLFGNGEEALHLAHRKIAVEQGQTGGDTDTVVGTQGRLFCDHPTVLDDIGYGVPEKVVPGSSRFLTDHVLVGLQDDGGDVLLAGRGFPGDQYVACRIRLASQRACRGPVLQVFRHRLFVSGLAWDPGDFLENVKN